MATVRRIILVGKCGNGKSSTGNSLLGQELFDTKLGMKSVTQKCQNRSKVRTDISREYEVVDTPGLFDTDQPFAKRGLDIQKALDICPKPHAFLLILRADQRYTQDEKLTLDMLRVIFGEDFLKHTILVLTRGSEVNSDEHMINILEESKMVDTLMNECGKRVVRVENNLKVDSKIRAELLFTLLDMVEKISDSGNICYSYGYLSTHQAVLETHLKNRKSEMELSEELKQLVEEIGRELTSVKWRSYLIGGLVGAGAAGVAMYIGPTTIIEKAEAVVNSPMFKKMAETGAEAPVEATAKGFVSNGPHKSGATSNNTPSTAPAANVPADATDAPIVTEALSESREEKASESDGSQQSGDTLTYTLVPTELAETVREGTTEVPILTATLAEIDIEPVESQHDILQPQQ